MRTMAVLLASTLAGASLAGAETRTLSVTVTDPKGTPVRGLAPEEVVVMEDGVARVVTRVEPDQRPLTLALLVDSSAPMSSIYRLNIMEPVSQFLTRLPAGTRFAVWTLGDRPQKLVDFGTDAGAASRALRRVVPQGGNTLLDALIEATEDLQKKKKEEERSAVVVVTGSGIGFANRDRRTVTDQLEDSEGTFLAVQFDEAGDAGVQGSGPDQVGRADYDYVLSTLTKATGGLWERPLSAMGLDQSLQKLSAELSGQYLLTYDAEPPKDPKAAGKKDRKLEVQVARPGTKVRVSPASAR